MEGNNTRDVECFGPNLQMSTWYFATLKGTQEMALYIQDDVFAKACQESYDKDRNGVDKNLFNSEYYEQEILKDRNSVAQLKKGTDLISWLVTTWRIQRIWNMCWIKNIKKSFEIQSGR